MRREHWIYIGFGIILVLLVVTYVYGDDSYWGPCRWGSIQGQGPGPGQGRGAHHGMHRGGNEFFGIGFYGFGLLFWVLVIFFVVLVFLNSKKEPIDILNKRYARGELSQEEYNRMKEELSR